MKVGLESLAPSFRVPRLEHRELADVYFLLRLDYPMIFYSVSFRYKFYEESGYVEMIPEYLFQKSKILEHQKALEARVKKLARMAEHLNEKEKELYVHDFICQNIHYDKLKKPYSHEIIGPLGHGVGVCEGIAKSVKILCDALGVWCVIAISEANPEKKIKYRHAWNIVKIGGVYYHLDATFDNTLGRGEMVRHDYFNLSDKQIFRDHEPVIWKVPMCIDGEHTYYREKKLSFTKQEEVKKRAAQAVRKGKTLLFQWRGGHLTREVLKELLEIVEEEAKKKEKHAYLSVNWAQSVIQISFQEILLEKQVVLEEANEGENIGEEIKDIN